jgi:hypothetical protein
MTIEVELRLLPLVLSVEMRRFVLLVEHPHNDAEEDRDDGHRRSITPGRTLRMDRRLGFLPPPRRTSGRTAATPGLGEKQPGTENAVSPPASDVDILVEFDRQHVPGLLGLAAMERELSAMLGGRRVDMRTPRDLSRYFRDEVIAHAVVQYAQG